MLDIATDFLHELLEAGQKAGFPEPTLRRAKKHLNIISKRLPNQSGPGTCLKLRSL